MNRYKITIKVNDIVTGEIEANTEKEAREIVLNDLELLRTYLDTEIELIKEGS